MSKLIISSLLIAIIGCQNPINRIPINDKLFYAGTPAGVIKSNQLLEASGLVLSLRNPGHLWIHNDSGDKPKIYLINDKGELKLTVNLKGARNIDWEDIALSTEEDNNYLYIGDIGDNGSARKNITIYKVAEPKLEKGISELTIGVLSNMKLKYAEGPRDAETLLYDQKNQEIIIVTKREEECLIYSFKYLPGADVNTIMSKGKLAFTGFTGGDSNVDNILLRTYSDVLLWPIDDRPIHEILTQFPSFRIPYYQEPQGEAIGWDNKKGFYTLSERSNGHQQELIYYQSKN